MEKPQHISANDILNPVEKTHRENYSPGGGKRIGFLSLEELAPTRPHGRVLVKCSCGKNLRWKEVDDNKERYTVITVTPCEICIRKDKT